MSKKPAKQREKPSAKRKAAMPGGGDADAHRVRLSTHPKAQSQIRLARSWAGLAGFALAAYSSWSGGTPFVGTAVRGLEWGVIAYLLVWFCAQQVWRHLAIAEVRAAERMIAEQHAELARRRAEQETIMMGSS